MEPAASLYRTLIPGMAALFCLFGSAGSRAQEASGEPVAEIPQNFFQIQDANGFFWQAAGNGALTSGETQYLQSGLNWIIDGTAFAPSSGRVRSPEVNAENAGVSLVEVREGLTLTRDLWFDPARGGVRVLDSVKNGGTAPVELEIVERTTYPFAWQSLHGSDGELLSKDPVLALDERDVGMVIHFSAAEGRHDTFLLVAGGEGSLRPRLTASTNRRELSLSYRIVIPAGGTQSLVHWIAQGAVPEMTDVPAAFQAFYARGQLVRSGVETSAKAGVVNFPATAFPGETAAPGGLKSLLSLNQLLDSIGIVRRGEDLHWISASNRITGTVSEREPLKLAANQLGEITLPLSQIAAIRGGAGIGLKPVIYLRDGQVRVGEVLSGELALTVEGAQEAVSLDLAEVNLLVLKAGASDGNAPKEASHLVQLSAGSVFAVAPPKDFTLPLSTPWGSHPAAFEELDEIGPVTSPFPASRIRSADGSIYSTFLPGDPVSLPIVGGKPIEIPADLIKRVWRTGADQLEIGERGEDWLSLEEIPGTESKQGLLLIGNHFLHAELSAATLRLDDGGAEVLLEAAAIDSMRRDFASDEAASGEFILELKNNDVIRGRLVDPFLTFSWDGKPIRIPVETFIAYRALLP